MAMNKHRLGQVLIDKIDEALIADGQSPLTNEQKDKMITTMRAIAEAIIEEIETHYEPPA